MSEPYRYVITKMAELPFKDRTIEEYERTVGRIVHDLRAECEKGNLPAVLQSVSTQIIPHVVLKNGEAPNGTQIVLCSFVFERL
jgi:hypothetical protein